MILQILTKPMNLKSEQIVFHSLKYVDSSLALKRSYKCFRY